MKQILLMIAVMVCGPSAESTATLEVTLASGTLSPVAQKTKTSLALAKQVLEIELDELKAVQSQLDA